MLYLKGKSTILRVCIELLYKSNITFITCAAVLNINMAVINCNEGAATLVK